MKIMEMPRLNFPEGFVWGTATAAYQIEGAKDEDGRGESIWDRFTATPGKIADGMDGSIACDHYHRFESDLDLMKELGLQNYRFSISWPRVVPDGSGAVNAKGLAFYDRLVDTMLSRGIRPFATLFHWDLPQRLQEAGGWTSRATVTAFARYAEIVAKKLGDRVKDWMTHNEPWVVAYVGHLFGAHAPGVCDLKTALAVAHAILLSHGKAVPVIRTHSPGARVGIVNNLEWVEPASQREEDIAAAMRHDGAFNRWFLDPLFRGSYPGDMMAWFDAALPDVRDGDLKTIAVPIDFLGVNYYTRRIMAHDPAGRGGSFLAARQIHWPFTPRADFEEWEVAPEGLYRTLLRVAREYRPSQLFVTENGTSLPDVPGPDGAVHDAFRMRYVARHAAAVHQAITDGADVRGYFLWSFMDNFEWAFGFTKRFGITYVDYKTQKRTIKDSGRWYSKVAQENGFATADASGAGEHA
jgi:beta-glucosidase